MSYDDPQEEKEYHELKLPLNREYNKWLFACIIILYVLLTWRYFVAKLLPQAYIAIGLIVLAVIIFLFRKKFEKCMQIISLLYVTGSLIFAIFNMREILDKVSPPQAFYMGYALSLIQRLIDFRAVDFRIVVLFNLTFIVVKFTLITVHGAALIVLVTFLQLIPIILGFQAEKADRSICHSLYKSKLQLLKFKKFLISSLPNEVAVFTQDFSAIAFTNNAFQKTFKSNFKKIDLLQDSLQNLILDPHEVEKHAELFSSVDESSKKSISLFAFIKLVITSKIQDIELMSFQVQEELQNSTLSNSYDRQTQFTEEALNGLNRSCSSSEELNLRIKRTFKVKIVPLIWDDIESLALVLDNVTYEKTIMELKVADKNKNLIIAMVSHELRTPLNGILGILEIIKNMLQQDEIFPYLEACKNSSLMLLNLVNSILDFSQIKSKKLKLVYTRVCILDLLNEVKSLFDYFCKAKNLYLNIEVHPEVPFEILTDETRLKQVLINLVGNAFKFTFKGGVTIKVDLVTDDDSPQKIQFTIQDTGIGIEKNDQEKLFKLFGRLDHQNSKINTHGVGLGLTISNTLIKQLNASPESKGIIVSSEPGEGTAFSFVIRCENTIPKADDDGSDIEDEMRNTSDNAIENKLNMCYYGEANRMQRIGSLRAQSKLFMTDIGSKSTIKQGSHSKFFKLDSAESIQEIPRNKEVPLSKFALTKDQNEASKNSLLCLIVDDNPFNLMVAANIMQEQGYKITTALNGQDAIQKVQEQQQKEQQFSLVLMDCQMPVMDGYEATRQLKAMMQKGEIADFPIVALTANHLDEEHDEICRKAGMDAVIGKPLNKTKLNNSIKSIMNQGK